MVHFSSTDSNSGSALLVQIVTSTARRLLLTAGEKTQLTMVTVEKPCFVAENLPNSVIVLFAFLTQSSGCVCITKGALFGHYTIFSFQFELSSRFKCCVLKPYTLGMIYGNIGY